MLEGVKKKKRERNQEFKLHQNKYDVIAHPAPWLA